MSMMVCTAPVVCADRPEVSLTKQEHEAIQDSVKRTSSLLDNKAPQILKAWMSLNQNLMSKMYVGKSISEVKQEGKALQKEAFVYNVMKF